MRPQFHHIDAAVEQERIGRAREPNISTKSEARAVHMTVKSQVDGENNTNAERPMAVRISTTQAEPWKNYRYIDEDEDEAWFEYSQSMFVCPGLEKSEDILPKLPQLSSKYSDSEFLDVISGQRDSARLAKKKMKEQSIDAGSSNMLNTSEISNRSNNLIAEADSESD